jgi:aryl carrier-like protein
MLENVVSVCDVEVQSIYMMALHDAWKRRKASLVWSDVEARSIYMMALHDAWKRRKASLVWSDVEARAFIWWHYTMLENVVRPL